GFYSTCGLLLRLRELYRSELGLHPGESIKNENVLPWIGKREELWAELEDEELKDITIGDKTFGPFDTDGVNRSIEAAGFIYGAGLGQFMKPIFFLAELESASEMNGFRVLVAGKEHARDLSVNPAMSRGATIIARRDITQTLIYGRFEEFLSSRNRKGALVLGFNHYGINGPDDMEALGNVVDSELLSFIHHEIGEMHVSANTNLRLSELISSLAPHGRAPSAVRDIKDVLADTVDGGMLRHITDNKKSGSLGLYISSLSGLRYSLSLPLRKAWQGFGTDVRWDKVEEARANIYSATLELACRLSELTAKRHGSPENLAANVEGLLPCNS
ncbi:MAG: hypothetical protein KAR83_06395, partial [Thermodesulfovibrionales bacterium]|nr:hypothetical protein [Thermodesulfovibrionales bacterium]